MTEIEIWGITALFLLGVMPVLAPVLVAFTTPTRYHLLVFIAWMASVWIYGIAAVYRLAYYLDGTWGLAWVTVLFGIGFQALYALRSGNTQTDEDVERTLHNLKIEGIFWFLLLALRIVLGWIN